jgi:3-hydroxyacyl-CoA dehydrogenase/enoyl-CoA hydratase/3-hydroxybutyryl-CoA epimerase
MERGAERSLANATTHWHWERDRDGLVWLTFDKQGESANTFSREALEELSRALEAIRTENPKGLVIRSAKDGFIAGADVEAFTRFKSGAEALAFVKLGWDVLQQLRDLPFPTTAMVNGFCMGGGTELALACRYRVALDDPKVRFLPASRWMQSAPSASGSWTRRCLCASSKTPRAS